MIDWLWNFSPLHFLDFYFLLLFFVGTGRRIGQYHAIVTLMLAGPGRWPYLLRLVKEHRTIFLSVSTVLPALLAFGLSMAQLIASRWIWPEAGRPPNGLSVGRLLGYWPALSFIIPLGAAMFFVDLYGIIMVGAIDRFQMEKYFDQAEYWLRSRSAHVVRVFTFGYIDPRKMVNEEVRKALVVVSQMLNTSLWWTTLQMGLRVCFCLSLWMTWAFTMTE
jgi:hypothetical protein